MENKLFEYGSIGNVEIKNRTVMSPMGTLGLADQLGIPKQSWHDYYVARARGGVGLIITGVQPVTDIHEELLKPNMPHTYENPEGYILEVRKTTEAVHAHGAKIFAQLTAGWGRSAIPTVTKRSVAPSAQPNRFNPSSITPEMTKEQIKELIIAFGKSAKVCKMAGYDGVEIHAVHEGYLLDQFTISFYNKRTDEYGGSLENRFRIIKEIYEEIRKTCGKDFPISIRYSSKSMMKGFGKGILPQEVETAKEAGRDLDEGLKGAKYLEEIGYDALNVDAGTYDSWYWNHPPMYFEKGGMYIPYTKPVKDIVNIPIIMAGRMDEEGLAESVLNDGICDFVAFGRPLLADENLVNKLATKDYKNIRPCLSCHDGCLAKQASVGCISCAVNPQVGRETEVISAALIKKKIAVIGAGPAGLEFARVATLRGHEVEIFEASDKIGGNLKPASKPKFKKDDVLLINWYKQQMENLNVKINLNTKISSLQEVEKYDEVVVAVGSTPIIPSIPMSQNPVNTLLAEDVLNNIDLANDSVTIIGGGLVGSELALHLAQNNKKVNVVDMASDIVGGPHGICPANYFMLKELFDYHNINQYLNSKVLEITDKGIKIEKENEVQEILTDQVIFAVGYKNSQKDMIRKLQKEAPHKVKIIGDAKQIKNIMNAVYEGYELARNI